MPTRILFVPTVTTIDANEPVRIHKRFEITSTLSLPMVRPPLLALCKKDGLFFSQEDDHFVISFGKSVDVESLVETVRSSLMDIHQASVDNL